MEELLPPDELDVLFDEPEEVDAWVLAADVVLDDVPADVACRTGWLDVAEVRGVLL